MNVDMHNTDEEIEVRIRELPETKCWTISIRRGRDEFTMYCDEKTDIQVLIDLLQTEALKVKAYVIR